MRPSAASSSRRRRPATWPDDRLPLLQDGRLSLELLGRYADEYDDHGEGATYPAATFVEYLRLEARARLIRVPTGLVEHALAPKARGRGRGARLPVATPQTKRSAPAIGSQDDGQGMTANVTSTDHAASRGSVERLPVRQRAERRIG